MAGDAADVNCEFGSSPPDTQMTLVRDGELTEAGHRRDEYEAARSTRTNRDIGAGMRQGGVTQAASTVGQAALQMNDDGSMRVDMESARGRRRARGPSAGRAVLNLGWSITSPKGRHIAVCATCCSEIPSRSPRVRLGGDRARVHHIVCASSQCGEPSQLLGWTDLDDQAKAAAAAQFDGSHAAPEPNGVAVVADSALLHDQGGAANRVLQRMGFWEQIPWRAMHDPIRTMDNIPDAVKPALAELRGSLASAANARQGLAAEENYLKCFFFLDRLLCAARRKQRGGARGQRGETVSRTIARRVRMAWEGSWGALWEESSNGLLTGDSQQLASTQRLIRDIQSIEEALADDDMREALRCVDAKMAIASDSKARRCLPALFPQAAMQPSIAPPQEPEEEDVSRFRRELRRAYSYAPAHRAGGPGNTRNEHWSWMPRFEEAWPAIEDLLLRFALAKFSQSVLEAWMSARVLAGDREEDDKVRPFALGIVHRRLVSKAIGRVFKARVAAAVGPCEHSIGSKGGAELMHKRVLVALDSRDGVGKASFDASNAHNEYDRGSAVVSVSEDVPELLPWVRSSLTIAAVHEHTASDGTRTQLRKTKGGDQGDAVTALIFLWSTSE